MFGIEQVETSNNPDFRYKYNLYPFKFNKKTNERIYYNHQMNINYRSIVLSIYYLNSYDNYGIHIKDLVCYKRLASLFEKSAKLNKVDLNINAVNSITKIVLIGEAYINNQSGTILVDKLKKNTIIIKDKKIVDLSSLNL
jgi:hypothetical protein